MTAGSIAMLTPTLASRFARIALGHVTREYPHKADHVMTGADGVYRPRDVHPIFYGSFDWHSCVHGYWLLARCRRLFPDLPEAPAIDALFADALTSAKVERERAYLDDPATRGFERPYGWAWLLMLAAELHRAGSPHAGVLQPLADAFAARFRAHLPLMTYPVRAGFHANSGFAVTLAHVYAATVGDADLRAALVERTRAWFGDDRAAQVWEPSGEDFLSPTLMEAVAMRRALSPAAFVRWFAAFLPDLADESPATLFAPVRVSDRSDGKIAHLDGLNLSRAWAFRDLAEALPIGTPARAVLEAAAERHLEAALATVSGDYMGEHWLASFAMLALTGVCDPLSKEKLP